MKGRSKIFLLSVLMINTVLVSAQYGNEWINYDQTYVKVKLAEDGIYRITADDLNTLGIDNSAITSSEFKMFRRGAEIAIMVEDGGDGWNSGDYIQFFGQRNDGYLDSFLYADPAEQVNPGYSLYSDTAAYFLTWSPAPGLRTSTYQLSNPALPIETSAVKEVSELYSANYARGDNLNFRSYRTVFDKGEGFSSNRVRENNSLEFALTGIVNPNPSDGNPLLIISLLGETGNDHLNEIYVGPDPSSLRLLGSNSFSGYGKSEFNSTLLWSDISATGELHIRVDVKGVGGEIDLVSVPSINLEYPWDFTVSGLNSDFTLNENPGGESRIQISGGSDSHLLYDITNPDNIIEIGYEFNSGIIEAVVDNTELPRDIFITENILSPSLENISMRLPDISSNDYVVITHKSLRMPGGNYQDPIRAFLDYRTSAAGGGFDTLLVNIDELYNQFSFGEITPYAIHKFVEFISQNELPDFLFIIGDAVSVRFNYHRSPETFNVPDLVPTAGFPGSDLFYSVPLGSPDEVPLFPVGRLPAITSSEVANYIDKVFEMESLPDDEMWMKEILHLSGGITTNEQESIFAYMERWEGYAEDIFFGADVTTIQKNTIEDVTFINISEEINQGKAIVSFFGHSNPSITDIDIGTVSDPINGYNNPGKYPIFFVNGCEAGRFFDNGQRWGEDWILTQGKGAVGFIAHSSYALTANLRSFGNAWYQNLSNNENYKNASIGDVHLQAINDYRDLFIIDNFWNVAMSQQILLIGDPAYVPFRASKPDFRIADGGISVPDNLTYSTLSDSIYLDVFIENPGLAIRDSLAVRVERVLEDGSSVIYDTLVPPVYFDQAIRISMDNSGLSFSGNNRFVVMLDPLFQVDELDELNNQGTFDLFVPSNGTLNIFPPDFGIVSVSQVPLIFQSTDLRQELESIEIQLDTSFYFDSPFFVQQTHSGEITAEITIDLLPDLPQNDSIVYYWRTRLSDPGEGENPDWSLSSFTFIKDSPEGWSQSEFFQFLANENINLKADTLARQLKFQEYSQELDLTTYGNLAGTTPLDVSVRINDLEYIINNGRPCRSQTINFITFDKNTGLPYAALPLPFQNPKTCGRQPQVINSFSNQELESGTDDLFDYINAVPQGDTVVVFNVARVLYSTWSDNVKNIMSELGIDPTLFETLDNNEPIIMVGSKGAPVGSAEIYLAETVPANEATINLVRTMYGRASEATIMSPRIGPAIQWGSFSRSITALETPSSDQYSFDIIGFDPMGTEQPLYSGITSANTDMSTTDAEMYPQVSLSANLADPDDLTSPQLDRWTVLYDYPPEGVLLTSLTEDQIQIQEGEEVEINFSFINVSSKSFSDSLRVDYSITSRNTSETQESSFKILQPAPMDTTHFKLMINSLGKEGEQDLFLKVNPQVLPEQEYNNNILIADRFMKVQADIVNPRIDVAIDGRKILDGEIVSANPLISVLLKDENQVLILNDTSYMDVSIRKECTGCDWERVSYSSNLVTYEAPDEESRLKFDYNPQLDDGIYYLRVEGTDASGNTEEDPYEISFEVVTESAVTNFYPYPNPFSDQMRFVFTLTGDEIPDDITVRIMTISGRVVREIEMDELGAVHIGNNLSDFRWDGTDEYGDRLANGVYLYQVRVMKDGKRLELRETSADSSFKNGIGKIYLLR